MKNSQQNLKTSKSNTGLILFATISLFFALTASSLFLSPVNGSFGPNTTGSFETLFFAVITSVIAIVWRTSMKRRVTDLFIRQCCTAIVVLIVFWSILSILSLACTKERDHLWSIYWYLSFAPLIIGPSLFFFTGLRIIALPNNNTLKTIAASLIAIDAVLVMFVLTNNFHMQVFSFDMSNPYWKTSFVREWGYFLIYGWTSAQLVSFIIVLLFSSRKGHFAALGAITTITLIILFYSVASLSGVSQIKQINPLCFYCLTFLLLLECCMRFRVYPITNNYENVLGKLPFQVFIYPRTTGKTFKTELASTLSPEEEHQLIEQAIITRANGEHSFHLDKYPNFFFLTYDVTGGHVVLGEDMGPLIKQREELVSRTHTLKNQMLVLEENAHIQEQLKKQEASEKLMAEIKDTLEVAMLRIEKLFNTLENNKNLNEKEKQLFLFEVKLLTSYAKRKCGLVLAANSPEKFDSQRLELVISEAGIDLRSIGFDCACIVKSPENLSASAICSLYDYFYLAILGVLYFQDVALMITVSEISSTEARLRIVAEFGEPAIPAANKRIQYIKKRMKELQNNDEVSNVSLIVSEDSLLFQADASSLEVDA